MQRVTSLEPRTPHQPGKLQKLSKNDYGFTLFIFRVNENCRSVSAEFSIECRRFTGQCRRVGAVHPSQAFVMYANAQFLWIFLFKAAQLCGKRRVLLVKISEKPLWAGHFEIFFAKVNFGSETDYMKASELVIDNEAFTVLRGECEKIIDTHKRLPDLVFRRSFAKYFAIEYGLIYGNKFGAFLFAISGIFGDESVHFMTIDPPPESYYSQCSFFGAASFERSRLVKRYVPVLSRERNVPKLLAGVNVGVLWGSSLK